MTACPACRGTGKDQPTARPGAVRVAYRLTTPKKPEVCRACDGSGRLVDVLLRAGP